MKYIYKLFLLFLFTLPINAQNDEVSEMINDYCAKAGITIIKNETPRQTTEAGSAAKIIYVPSAIIAHTLIDGKETVTRNTYSYNNMGARAAILKQNDNGGGWKNVQLDSVFYYSSGKTSMYVYYVWSNDQWLMTQRSSVEYDESGRTKLTVMETLAETGWIKFQIETIYNAHGLVEEGLVSRIVDGNIVPQQRYRYAYDGKGAKTELLVELRNGETWTSLNQYLWGYNENDFMTYEQYSVWKGAGWQLNERIDYTPNAAGDVLYGVTQLRVNGTIDKTDSSYYTYDENRRVLGLSYAYWKDGRWVNSDSIAYSYTAADKYQAFSRFLWEGNVWKKWQRYTFTYNLQGSMLSTLTEEGTGSNEWINSSMVAYEYDENNKMKKGESFTWNNNAWVYATGSLDLGYARFDAYLAEVTYIQVDSAVGVDDDNLNPEKFALAQNYPNPFNPETKISFSLPQSGKASLKIYDMLGREVAELVNSEMEKGVHSVNFSGRNLSSGVYIYRLQSGNFTESKKMMLMK